MIKIHNEPDWVAESLDYFWVIRQWEMTQMYLSCQGSSLLHTLQELHELLRYEQSKEILKPYFVKVPLWCRMYELWLKSCKNGGNKQSNILVLVKNLASLHFQTFGHCSHVFVYIYLELTPSIVGASFSHVGRA